MESINTELSFDTKIVWLGLFFVLRLCQETCKKQPQKREFCTIVDTIFGRL